MEAMTLRPDHEERAPSGAARAVSTSRPAPDRPSRVSGGERRTGVTWHA